MNLSANGLNRILKEGIDQSESLLCFHLSNNHLDDKTRTAIDMLATNSKVLHRNNLTNYANDYDEFIEKNDK